MANCKLLFRFCKAPSKLDSTESASTQLQCLSRLLCVAGIFCYRVCTQTRRYEKSE